MLSYACSLPGPGLCARVWAGCHPHEAHVALSLSRHPAGWEPGRHGKGCLPKPKQPALIGGCSRACLLCLIAGLWLNPLQEEELITIQGGMTIVSHIPGL